jgi:hypothetical protein
MNTKNYDCLGLSWLLPVTESVDEFDQKAGRVGACHDEAVNNIVYRAGTMLPAVRYLFVEAIAKETGIKRNQVQETETVDGKEVTKMVDDPKESDGKFLNKILAQTGKKVEDFTHLQADVLAHTDKNGQLSVRFDPKERERKEKKDTMPKRYLDGAGLVLIKIKAKNITVHQWAHKKGVALAADADETTTILAIAAFIREAENKTPDTLADKYSKL